MLFRAKNKSSHVMARHKNKLTQLNPQPKEGVDPFL